MDSFPKIRAGVEALPAVYGGREVLVLHDRLGVSGDLVLDRSAAPFLALLDGSHALRDIQAAFMRRHGLSLDAMEGIRGLVESLDRQYLLENDRFRERMAALVDEFRRQTVREATHAGSAYPEDKAALTRCLDGYFLPPEGPGDPPGTAPSRPLRGLVLPHIDFDRGGHCYAWGYAALREGLDAELIVILGTCHLPMQHPFALTGKSFETPLGKTASAAELAEEISRRSGLDLFSDELVHRSEHSIEFQVVFLQHCLRNHGGFRILPVLCAGFHEMVERRVLPRGRETYERCLAALADVLDASGLRSCLIASADLAHLGPQFGDPRPIQSADLPALREQDLEMLEPVLQGDADGFFRRILAEGDRRRICGLPPIYSLLRLLDPLEGRLLKYDQAFHPQATVSFASIGFW